MRVFSATLAVALFILCCVDYYARANAATPSFPGGMPAISYPSVMTIVPTPGNVVLTLPDKVGSNPYYLGGTVDWDATCVSSVPIQSMQLLADGSPVGTPDTIPPFSGTWTAPYTSDASVTVKVRCLDVDNHYTDSSAQMVMIDVTPPSIDSSSPESDQYVSNTLPWSVEMSDENSGVSGAQLYINDSAVGIIDSTSPFEGTYPLTQADGTVLQAKIKLLDNVGNSVFAEPVAITVDNSAPTVSITSPSAGTYSGTINLTSNPADTVSGIVAVEYYWGTALLGEVTIAPWALSFNTTQRANGTALLTAKAYNGSGLTATSAGVSLTINNIIAPDTQPPGIVTTISAAPNSTSPSTAIDLNWSAATDNVAVDHYHVQHCLGVCSGSTDSCSPWIFIGDTSLTTFTDSGLTPNTSYCYRMWTYDTSGNISTTPSFRTSTVTQSSPSGGGTVNAVATIGSNPSVITTGQSTTLTWSSMYASSCAATTAGAWTGAKSTNGSFAVSPTSTTNYIITCQGDTGVPFSDSTTVVVNTGTQYYVSTSASASDSNPGTISQPWKTISKANGALQAGQTVWIRGGTYYQQIQPTNNGNASAYISYLAYPGETAIILRDGSGGAGTSGNGADLTGKSYIVIAGMHINNVSGTAVLIDSGNRNIIRDNVLTQTNITGGGNAIRWSGDYNLIRGNQSVANDITTQSCTNNCKGYQDCFRPLGGADHNLVEDNDIGNCRHVALNAASSVGNPTHHNIYRRNKIRNTWHSNVALYSSQFDVLEDNIILDSGIIATQNGWLYGTNASRAAGDQSGIQTGTGNASGAQSSTQYVLALGNIIRRNSLNNNGQISFDQGTKEQCWAHNVIYNTDQNGMYRNSSSPAYLDVLNNIFLNNIYNSLGKSDIWFGGQEINGRSENVWRGNDIIDDVRYGGDPDPNPTNLGTVLSVSSLQSSLPNNWSNNITSAVTFASVNDSDFHLTSSAQLNAGVFLATITSATASSPTSTFVVSDARCFSDGYGIPGYKGDLIMTQTGKKTARITNIDISTRTITVSPAITWTQGEGISYIYLGSAPDIGVFEQ